jgi:hypothetical protein
MSINQPTNLLLIAFMSAQALRSLASLPQILCAWRDPHRCMAISSSSNIIYLLGNITTALYGGVALGDVWIVSTSMSAALGNAALHGIIIYKRREPKARHKRPEVCTQLTIQERN